MSTTHPLIPPHLRHSRESGNLELGMQPTSETPHPLIPAKAGSHRHFYHPTKSGKVTIHGKPSDDVLRETWADIMRQAGLKERYR